MPTRRDMLKGMIAAATTALLPRLPIWTPRAAEAQEVIPITPEPPGEDEWELHGRAIHTVVIYEEPSTASARQATYYRDQSFPILGEVRAPFSAHNDLWYETDEGYVHSAWVLPIRVYPSQPFIETIGDFGFWGEVSQIYTEGYTSPSTSAGRKYRFYGGTVFHVIDTFRDEAGTGWYKVFDDYPPRQSTNHQWVLAEHMRRVPRAEIAPIHPFVGNKRIDVVLDEQSLTCYEGDEVVFSTLVASGLGGSLATPKGEHCVLLKQASRHMSNVPYADMRPEDQPAPGGIFDLPGVPWNIFFDLAGTAIHGAYWHNDFGVRRSHGCLNVSIDAARWIYRWVHPIGGYEDDFIQSNCAVGTPVIVR
ncbi:MAG: L,D-transpeptidase [Anaerolineae bacterium]